jgi:hypothetical protein
MVALRQFSKKICLQNKYTNGINNTGAASLSVSRAFRHNEFWGDLRCAIKNIPIKLILYDDKSDNTTSVQLYEKLVTQDKVNALLGGYGTPLITAHTVVAEKYRVPTVKINEAYEKLEEKYNPDRNQFIKDADLWSKLTYVWTKINLAYRTLISDLDRLGIR